MVDFNDIFGLLRIILFGLTFLIAVIYAIPIIFIRRFHHANILLTLNICLATACCSFYWFIFYIMLMINTARTYQFMINTCVFVVLVPTILTLQVPFSFVIATINRFCCVVYFNKTSFQKKRWVLICVTIQWVFGTLVTLPILLGVQSYCSLAQWVNLYSLIFIVVFPSIAFLITNTMMYIYVRLSSRRIQPIPSVARSVPNTDPQPKPNRRDVHLLRHMVFMFSIFIGGWTPLYTVLAIQKQFSINPILLESLTIWCQLALLCNIIDLFLYNHELRKYLKASFLRCIQ